MSDTFANARANAPAGDPISDAIGEVILARQATETALQAVQHALEVVERENVELRKQILESDLRWYTEEALAQRIGCSADVLARLRKKKRIPYTRFSPRLFRYSSLDELQIARLLAVEPKLSLARSPRREEEGIAA
jgi:hypothetical protein